MAKNKGKWVRRNVDEPRAVLSRFEGSGLGVTVFCHREQISVANLYRWQRESGRAIEGGDGTDGGCPSAFMDLGALGTRASTPPARIDLRLDLGDGLVLHRVRYCNR